MATFCTPNFYHGASAEPIAIKGLFHFLDNLSDDLSLQTVLQESLSQQQQQPSTSVPVAKKEQPLPFFTPRFDISETDDAYHLHGDLAGLSKEHIDIDFTDTQTITVRGKVLRNSVPASTKTQPVEEDVVVDDAAPSSPVSSHNATVEDDFEDLAAEVNTATSSSSAASTPEKTIAAAAKKQAQKPREEQTPAKYWISERKYGQFARSFKFRKTVDVASVSASLDNGVLSIFVPKKNESRKIFVQ